MNAGEREAVTVLGATGSVGLNTLDLIARQPDRFRVEAVTANRNALKLAELARSHGARFAAIADPAAYRELKSALAGTGIQAAAGPAALIEAAQRPAARVMAAIVGAAGLAPALAAVERGGMVLLANKECLVCAGQYFMEAAAKANARILPVDSEHSAIFQALAADRLSAVEAVTLTASGGPFRDWPAERLAHARPEEAICHPNWAMGAKISIDSATLMNKGLELIEAHHLFSVPPDRLRVLVHPESIVHGLVAFTDGSVIAQMAPPDMRIPIAYSLSWPERMSAPTPRLDLADLAGLTFEAPDLARFPALRIALAALREGGGAPTVLNAANEVAVAAYLNKRISFPHIAMIVEQVLNGVPSGDMCEPSALEDALALDARAREMADTAIRASLIQAV